MPWKEQNEMSLRAEFIQEVQRGKLTFAELCRRFNISRVTGYKWIERYKEEGLQGLQNRSKRPKSSPNKTSAQIRQLIKEVKDLHPAWGAKKIHVVLKRCGHNCIPAISTINKILKEEGYVDSANTPQRIWQRFEHEEPNLLWQMDFKGHFSYANGRCHPLTILDDHSRFVVGLFACLNEKESTVKSYLIDVFQRYGLPRRINVDNGSPWGSVFRHSRYTSLGVWIIKAGVKISHSRPYHPQTNGKDERFHRTLKAEVITPKHFSNLNEIQTVFDDWRNIYNKERPHEGIKMQVPADRYHSSYRSYASVENDFDYANDYALRKVDQRGRVHICGRQIYVGIAFAKETIGFRTIGDGRELEVYFWHQKLGHVDLSNIQKGAMINLYGGHQLVV